MTIDKSIARLKEASRTRNVNEFCALIGPLLSADFGRWFEIVREQRLLENFRERAHIETIRIALFSALTDQPEHFLLLSIHVDVCLLAQRVFDWIDAETKAISAEPLNEDRYKETIIRISEVVFEAEGRNIESQIATGLKPTGIHQFMGAENFLRNTADICNVLLNSPYPVRSRVAAKELSDDPDFDRLISLARTYLSVKGVFDMYTYGHFDVAECTAGSVKFVDRILLHATARAVAAERNGSNDNARMHPLNFVARELEKNISEPSDAEDFQDFLSRQVGLFPLLQRLAEVIRNDLVWEVEEYFDTGTMIDRKRGITVRDLIDCWAVLRVFSNLVARWQHGRTWDVVRSSAVAHMRRSLVVKAVQQFAICSGVKARALVRRFQEKANKRSVDLFFTPLVSTAQPGTILLGSRFINGGRFERNLFFHSGVRWSS